VNKVVLIGRLTANPELKHTPAGTAVTKFTLAVDRRQAKDREKETDFIDIVVWQKQAENCANYLAKGKLAAVDGRLQIRAYDDNQGNRRKVAEVVAEQVKFLSPKESNHGQLSSGKPGSFSSDIQFNNEDIPF
jgi:single-strand DNA-binding protein